MRNFGLICPFFLLKTRSNNFVEYFIVLNDAFWSFLWQCYFLPWIRLCNMLCKNIFSPSPDYFCFNFFFFHFHGAIDESDPLSYVGKIIECSWRSEERVWVCMRIRTDKGTPNDFNTYKKVLCSNGIFMRNIPKYLFFMRFYKSYIS